MLDQLAVAGNPPVRVAASGIRPAPRRPVRGAGTPRRPDDTGPTGTRPVAGWSRSFEKPARAIYGLVVAVTVVFAAVSPAASEIRDVDAWMMTFSTALVFSAGYVWWRGFDRYVLAAVHFVLFLTAVAPPILFGTADIWWAWQPWVTSCVLTGAVCTIRSTLLVTGISSVTYLAARLQSGAATIDAASEIVAGWQAAILVCLVLRSWRRIAAVGDRSEVAAIDEAGRAAAITAGDRAEQLAARTLHDRVLHTLRAATADRAFVPSADLSRMAVDALAAFDPAHRAGPAHRDDPDLRADSDLGSGTEGGFLADRDLADRDLAGRLREVADRSGVDVRLAVAGGRASNPLPEPVCRALLDAAGEVLRNVRRHAGVTSASMTLHRGPDGVELAITDHGRGFDPERVPARSRGLTESVRGAMTTVNGSVEVRTAPGCGTDVRLRWPAASRPTTTDPRVADMMVELGAGRRGLLVAVAVPEAAGGMVRCLLWAQTTSASGVVWVSAAVGLTGLLVAAYPVWTGAHLGRQRAAGAALLAVVAVAAAGLALGPEGSSHGLATVEIVAPIVMMMAWQRRFREALALGALIAGVAAAAAAATSTGIPGYLPQVLLCPLAAVELRLLRHFVAADARRVDGYYRAERLTAQAAADAEASRYSETRRMRRLRPMVVPTLTALAAGQLDLQDPSTRTALTVLDAAVRDDLQVGDGLSPRTRTLVDQARAAGITVDVTGPPGPEIALRDHLDPLIELALGHPWRPSSVSLTARRDPDGTSTVALLVRPGLPPGLPRPSVPVVDTDDLTLLRLRLPGGGP